MFYSDVPVELTLGRVLSTINDSMWKMIVRNFLYVRILLETSEVYELEIRYRDYLWELFEYWEWEVISKEALELVRPQCEEQKDNALLWCPSWIHTR